MALYISIFIIAFCYLFLFVGLFFKIRKINEERRMLKKESRLYNGLDCKNI